MSGGKGSRQVFFSFHFKNDLSRVNHVRANLPMAMVDVVGFFDPSEYEQLHEKSEAAIRRSIARRLEGTSVTVVLIGMQTAKRRWVREEIELSIARRNGLLGLYIQHLPDLSGEKSLIGSPVPYVPKAIPFPKYRWDDDPQRFIEAIEAASRRSESWRHDVLGLRPVTGRREGYG